MLLRKISIRTYLCSASFCILPNVLYAQTSILAPSPVQSVEGFALQAAVGYQPYVVNLNHIGVTNTNVKLNDQNDRNHSTPYFVGASYTTMFSGNITLGAQIEINPFNQQYVLSLLPGYALTPNIHGYLKLAWVNALVTVDPGSNQNKVSATVNGAAAGLGIKQFWTPNWYGFVEANYVKMNTFKFSSVVNGIPLNGNMDYSGYNAMVGVGYKF